MLPAGFSEKALVYALTFLCQSYLDTQPTERNTINSLQALRLGPTVDGETLSLLAGGWQKRAHTKSCHFSASHLAFQGSRLWTL